jgi:ABC-type uncharacterized transport system substrate-binding protein
MFRTLVLIPLLACCSAPTSATATDINVSIIKSSDAGVYDSVGEAFERRLAKPCKRQQPACIQVETQSFIAAEAEIPSPPQDLVITLGLKAREYAERHFGEGSIINAMIPTRNGHLSKSAIARLKHPTLILDQPPIRSLLLIKHLLPGAKQVGLLISRDNAKRVASLKQAAERLDLRLIVSIVDDETKLGKQLAGMLDEIDVLLALPDIKIHNRNNVSSILLTTYRNRIPLIGFSAAYVKAGALAAIYSTPENIADQLAELTAQSLSAAGAVKQIISPKYFSVSINSRVARSLGVQLKLDSDKLAQLIRDAEQ